MKIKKILKIKSIFLSAVMLSGYFLKSVYASDEPKYYLLPSPTASQGQNPSNEAKLQKLKKKVSRICQQKTEEQKKEQVMRKLKKRFSAKIREKTDEIDPGTPQKQEKQDTEFAFPFGSDFSALPDDKEKTSDDITAIPMDCVYPCDPLEYLMNNPFAPPCGECIRFKAPDDLEKFHQEFAEFCREAPDKSEETSIAPGATLNILPEFTQQPSSIFTVTENTSNPKTSPIDNLLDIIFVPGASICCTQFPSPMLVVGINKNFKELLSDAEFEAKAREEIIDWIHLHTILEGEDIKNCLANVETIITSTKIFKILNETLGLRGWNTICCDSLSPNSRLTRRSLNSSEIIVSHRPDSFRYKSYDTYSVRLILSYFADFAKFIELDNGLLYHPLFSNKELNDAIDRLSALLESISYEDDIFAYLDSDGCILKTITKNTYRNPTLQKIQLLFNEAAQNHDLHSLLRAIGYFNFVRAVKIYRLNKLL